MGKFNRLQQAYFISFLILPLGQQIAGDVLDIANFNLRPNAFGTGLRDRADQLGEVLGAKASVTQIMGNLNRPESGGIVGNGQACNPRGVAVPVNIDRSKFPFTKCPK
jgi:hypothetical protein